MFKDYAGEPTCTYVPGDRDAMLSYGPMFVCKDIVAGGTMFGPTELVGALHDESPFPPYTLSLLPAPHA